MYNILYIWLESFSLLLHSASNQLYGYAQLVINDAWGFSASGYARANCVNLNGNGIFVVRACEIRSLLIAATHRVKYTHIHTHMLAVSLQNPFICLYYSFLTLTLSLSLSVLLYCGYLAKRNRSRVSHWQTENTEIYVRHFRLWLTGGRGGVRGRGAATYVYDYLRLCATRRCYSRASFSLYQHFVTPCKCLTAYVCVCVRMHVCVFAVLRVDLIFFCAPAARSNILSAGHI